ncbi:MAG: hypothetical protein QNJ94_17830 [Alphaproteobacteria bacterium]|nr:hypothetical protein [Alphaproteobacteria bacterium]
MNAEADACACRAAVERVYLEMRERGRGDVPAFETAVRVYRIHHPEQTTAEARSVVADWLDPTDG